MNWSIPMVCTLGLLAPAICCAGPDWVEGGDAGSLPGSAQTVSGSGPLNSVSGTLTGTEGVAGDFEDMYLVQVRSFAELFVTTAPSDGKEPAFDTNLFLFTGPGHPDGVGRGVLANMDCPGCVRASTLTGAPTDGSATPMRIDGLLYYLAISGGDRVPLSAGEPIFSFGGPTEVSGPDGLGGTGQVEAWGGTGETGPYNMPGIIGVAFVPVCPADLNADGDINGADLGLLLQAWDPLGTGPPTPADLNHDGVVDGADLGLLLQAWGPCQL